MSKLVAKMVDERLVQLRQAQAEVEARTQEYSAAVAQVEQTHGAAVKAAKAQLKALEDGFKKWLKSEQEAVFGAKELLVVKAGSVYRQSGTALVKSKSALGWFTDALNALVAGLGSWAPFRSELLAGDGGFIESISAAAKKQGLKVEISVDWDEVKTWPMERQVAAGLEHKHTQEFTWEVKS